MHTPGPWEAPRNGREGQVYRPDAPQGTLWRICGEVHGLSDDELAGNALLIAAAPELLAAAKAVLAHSTISNRVALKKAIDKAEGRE